jgi:hypothetical protein
MAWDAFGSGNWSEGLKQTVYGLISIVPGGGFLIKGYEWLSSFLSASKEEQQAQINEGGVMGTIKGWISQIGTYISDNAMSLPIVGGIKRFGMAWDAFTSGNIGEGFKLLGEGVLAFVGGGPLVNGFNMLAGWLLGGETEDEKSLSPDGSWKDRLKNWIKGKLHKLPAFLRKPLEWFGILDETGAETGDNATVSAPKPTSKNKNGNIPEEESKGFFSKMADSIGSGLESLGSLASDMFSSLKTLGKNAFDAAFKKFSEILPELEKFTSDIFDKFSNQISLILPKIESAMIVGVDNLYNMLSSAFDKISPKISEALQGVGSIIVDVFNAAKPTISESLKGIGSIIVDVFNAAKPIVSDSFSSYLESLKDIFSGIIPDIKSVMLNAFVKLSEDIINLAGEIPNNKYETLTNNEKGLNSKNDQTEFKNNEAISVAQIIEHASLNQCKYLEALVNIGNLTLKEMKRMNGSSGSASVIPQPIPMMSDGGKNRISLSDNRMGYAGSVYALG